VNSRALNRYEGRLFAESGVLFLVVEANLKTSTARVSCRVEGDLQLVEMPLEDVQARLAATGELKLDNVNGPNAEKRIVKQNAKFFFSSREGNQGPFASAEDAKHALACYIIASQSDRDNPPQRRSA